MSISSRRDFISLLTGTGVAAAVAPLAAAAAEPARGMARLRKTVATHDYTLLADPTHADIIDLLTFMASKETADCFKAAGVKTFGDETPAVFQHGADLLSAQPGNQMLERSVIRVMDQNMSTPGMTPEQNTGSHTRSAELVVAYSPQIKVVFGDNEQNSPAIDAMERTAHKAMAEAQSLQASGMDPVAAAYKAKRDNQREIDDAGRRVREERQSLPVNAAILDRIDHLSPPGYPRVILFGAAHIPAMQEILKKKGHSVAVIALHKSDEAYCEHLRMKPPGGFMDYGKVGNFLMDQRRFSDEPSGIASFPRPVRPLQPHPR